MRGAVLTLQIKSCGMQVYHALIDAYNTFTTAKSSQRCNPNKPDTHHRHLIAAEPTLVEVFARVLGNTSNLVIAHGRPVFTDATVVE